MQIQDGTGKGHWVKIDNYNRLHVYSTLKPEISDVSVNQERAYSVTTPLLTFNSTNEHPFLLIKNKDPDLIMFFSSVIYSYNGGNTNFNRSMTKRVYTCPVSPTDRYEEVEPINLNVGSLNTALLEVYRWDGVSGTGNDGMELDSTLSNNFSTSIVPKGSLVLNEIEAVNLKYNSCVLFTYQPEEIGNASISTKLYFNHF